MAREAPSVLTDDYEGVVDVDAAEAIHSFADVRAGVIGLHLLDLQAHPEDAETNPATVDVAAVFGPHYEGRRVSLHRTRQLDGAAQPSRLPVSDLLRHMWRSWRQTNVVLSQTFYNGSFSNGGFTPKSQILFFPLYR